MYFASYKSFISGPIFFYRINLSDFITLVDDNMRELFFIYLIWLV